MLERRKACAEIVERHAQSFGSEMGDAGLNGVGRAGDEHVLGDFERDMAAGVRMPAEQVVEVGTARLRGKRDLGDVDRHFAWVESLGQKLFDVVEHAARHMRQEIAVQAKFVDLRDKVVRGQGTFGRVNPAGECLEPDAAARGEVDLGLVLGADFAAVHRGEDFAAVLKRQATFEIVGTVNRG